MNRLNSIISRPKIQMANLQLKKPSLRGLRFTLSAGWVVGIVTVIVILAILGIVLDAGINDSGILDWLRTTERGATEQGIVGYEVESGSITIRNIGLAIVAAVALLIAIWRGQVAQDQTEVSRQDLAVSRQDLAVSRQDLAVSRQILLNERYQKGAEMLGSNVLAVRLGGIYALQQLAEDYPTEYHITVMKLFCAFARFPTKDTEMNLALDVREERDEQMPVLRADVQDIMQAVGSRSETIISSLETGQHSLLYLRDANLSNLQIRDVNLSGAWLTYANLSCARLPGAKLVGARFRKADLSGARLRRADLSGAKFWGAKLSGANLSSANLSGADLCGVDAVSSADRVPVCGLTQTQLDRACAELGNPPKLGGVIDALTGKQLVWRGSESRPRR